MQDPYGGDFHLAELVRTLQVAGRESPERQAKMEGADAEAYASGQLKVDADAATASP